MFYIVDILFNDVFLSLAFGDVQVASLPAVAERLLTLFSNKESSKSISSLSFFFALVVAVVGGGAFPAFSFVLLPLGFEGICNILQLSDDFAA